MTSLGSPSLGNAAPSNQNSGGGLSVVVQGPCERIGRNKEQPSIDEALASIRAFFPKAQLIVSTWAGSDIDGLDADDIVLNTDPGPLEHPRQRPNNINRMLTSTANGLNAATRPFCIKTRSDVLFRSDNLIHKELALAADHLSLRRRIWIASNGTGRIDMYLRPFHPCDMVQYGMTEDLRRLWNIPLFSWDDIFLPDPNMGLPRMCPEQALSTGYLKTNNIDVGLDMTIDGRIEIIEAALDMMLGAFDVFDEAAEGVIFSPRLAAAKYPHLLETSVSFAALRDAWIQNPAATTARVHAAFHERMEALVSGRMSITQDPAACVPETASL